MLLPCLCPKRQSVGTFWPTLQQKSCGWHHYQPKQQHPVIIPTSFLCNRVVSSGLALLGAVHEHPKNRNNLCAQAHFLALSIQVHATIQHLMKKLTGNLTTNFHTNFWVAIFPFFQKWHHTCLRRAYTEAEGSLHIGYHLGFQPHPAQERTIPHPM